MALTRPKYSQIYDTDWKQSVDVATTADVGNLFAGNLQPSTVDSISLGIGNRILVKDQSNGAQNGLYVVRSVGTGSDGWWVRTLDSNQNNFVTSGLAVSIVSGTINGGKEYKLTTIDPIILDVTALTFINPFAAAGAGGGNAQIQFNDNSILNGTAGLTFNKFSNAVNIGGSLTTLNAGNISAGGYFLGNGALLTGIVTSGGGGTNYSNVNVAAYTETMGFTNYSNVNVSALITTNGLTNYSNVNVAAYTRTQSYTNYSNVNLSAYLGGAVTIGGNLTVNGNLFINGNATTINSNNLTVNDSMIYLADENPADTLDIGITAHVVNPTLNHVGFVRDATDSTWKLFSNVVAQPTNTVDFTGANYANILVGNISATYFTGNGAFLTGLASSYSNVQVATYLPTYSGNIANLRITSDTTSTSTTTGALIVTGGVGVGGNLNVSGEINTSGTVTALNILNPFLLAGM